MFSNRDAVVAFLATQPTRAAQFLELNCTQAVQDALMTIALPKDEIIRLANDAKVILQRAGMTATVAALTTESATKFPVEPVKEPVK